jgi:hypothetical protein
VRPNSADPGSEEKDIAKYFVLASTIRAFISANYPNSHLFPAPWSRVL